MKAGCQHSKERVIRSEEIQPAHLNKRIALLVVDLNGEDRVARSTRCEAHLGHLGREELMQVLFVGFVSDVADIKTTGLPGQVGSGDASGCAWRRERPERGELDWRDTDDGWLWLRAVGAWEVE